MPRRFVFPAPLASLILLCLATSSRAQVVTDIYDFSADYSTQWLTLAQGRDASLYGNTTNTMFRLGTNGAYSEIYSYPTGTQRGLTFASDGNFYGTLEGGGSQGATVSRS